MGGRGRGRIGHAVHGNRSCPRASD
jgi:hypothetical protein